MGKGARYPHIVNLLQQHYNGGRVLELGAGGANYRDIFNNYVATDLPYSTYNEHGDINVFCDARNLPFENKTFDFAFMVGVLCLIPSPDSVCQEVSRVLKTNGKFLVFDYSLRTKKELMKNHDKKGENVHMNYWTRIELTELLQQSGFSSSILMETKPYWKTACNIFPYLSDHLRYWLMIKGVNT